MLTRAAKARLSLKGQEVKFKGDNIICILGMRATNEFKTIINPNDWKMFAIPGSVRGEFIERHAAKKHCLAISDIEGISFFCQTIRARPRNVDEDIT